MLIRIDKDIVGESSGYDITDFYSRQIQDARQETATNVHCGH